ncbi:hypothetical protein [Nannocystis sp. SCPEA4]|uniref:hypothetical protein n=1 Tax=Nannocystis sp. SCPEA4 TaxID=2996787 RepID=UPI00226EC098|nr:hypothetical protein [Nannocystis sp. SCPEA4]MCY1062978.1 hypothetical protein [Nannocystis sp. SCPEA4]
MCVLSACSGDKAGETEGETSTSTTENETSADPTEAETSADPTEAETSADPTEGETGTGTTEGETGTSTTEGETGDTSLLETCVFDPPCRYESAADIAEPEMSYNDALCAWTLLRDAAPSRVDLDAGGDESSLIPLGDAARSVLLVRSIGGDEVVQRCTLAEAAFFQGCIDGGPEGLGEGCAFGFGWYDGCVDEPAAVCPAA